MPALEAEHTVHVDAYTFGWEDDDVPDEVHRHSSAGTTCATPSAQTLSAAEPD